VPFASLGREASGRRPAHKNQGKLLGEALGRGCGGGRGPESKALPPAASQGRRGLTRPTGVFANSPTPAKWHGKERGAPSASVVIGGESAIVLGLFPSVGAPE